MRFCICGITVDISFPLVAVMTAAIIYDSSMSAAVCLIAVIMHESGHLSALWRFGSMPKHIRLTLFDIAIVDRKKPLRSLKRELFVVLAGIASNLFFAAISVMLDICFPCSFFSGLVAANLTLAAFNGLPVDSLDGGQALFLLLCEKMTMYRAMIVLDIISFTVLVPTGCLGFLVLLRSRYNFTLLLTSLYLISLILIRHSRLFRRSSDV